MSELNECDIIVCYAVAASSEAVIYLVTQEDELEYQPACMKTSPSWKRNWMGVGDEAYGYEVNYPTWRGSFTAGIGECHGEIFHGRLPMYEVWVDKSGHVKKITCDIDAQFDDLKIVKQMA